MSEENAQTILAHFEAMNRRDADATAAIVDMCDPEVEWRTELIGTPVYRGHDGIRQALQDIDLAWEFWRSEPTEILEGNDKVFFATHATARARGTGIPVEADLYYVAHFRRDKVIRFDGFRDRSKALEAAGLPE
jgi:ketosteroid isomerase-like protein